MRKSLIGNVLAIGAGVVVGAGTMYISYTRLKQPEFLIDQLALVFTGLTTGIIAFFVVWGHFQKDPAPPPPHPPQSPPSSTS